MDNNIALRSSDPIYNRVAEVFGSLLRNDEVKQNTVQSWRGNAQIAHDIAFGKVPSDLYSDRSGMLYSSGTAQNIENLMLLTFRKANLPLVSTATIEIEQLFTQATHWPKVQAAFNAWSSLEAGWDGEEAVAPSAEQLHYCRTFAWHCQSQGIREPEHYIAQDGEIGLHWKGELTASVSFLPSGRFLAFCPQGNGNDVRISGPLDIATGSPTLFGALAKVR
ncbi:hypothetical protein ACLB0R_01295 [Sphingomonas sp. GlSt437]|uniref:hypothetical protein n=1 Tax=Sphingomonas sp. GlSt437 TaxID=3389970 RepID=UPI003A84A19B